MNRRTNLPPPVPPDCWSDGAEAGAWVVSSVAVGADVGSMAVAGSKDEPPQAAIKKRLPNIISKGFQPISFILGSHR